MEKNNHIKILTVILFLLSLFTSCCSGYKSNKTKNNVFFRLFDEGQIATDGGQSRGVAWGDYDNDGDPDLYIANADGQWNFLYRNEGNGKFKKITSAKIKASETVIYGGNSQGVNWVDYDNDKDLDLFIVSRGKETNLLFRNEGLSVFTRITDNALTNQEISASMACWADMDNDGDLDVFLAGYSFPNLLFQNIGNGQFERIKSAVITEKNEGKARACACGDSNNDGLPELYVANARTKYIFS